MSKKKRIIIIISIITFAMLLVGGTFAWLIFDGALVFGNSQAQSSCFVIDYDYTNDDGTMDLSGTLMQTSVPKTGLSGKVQLGIHPDCSDTMGEGTIYLNVASADNPLLQPVAKAHCENPLTLQTMKNYTTSSACTSAGYTWVSNKPALKYAVYEDIDSNPVSVGYINKTGDITLYDGFTIYGSKIPYYIYIWLDGELANNSYMNVNFTGNIHLEVNQTEGLEGEAYAIYSADDNSLRFYRSTTPITVGDTYEGRIVTNVYTGFETESYTTGTRPWEEISANIKHVVMEDIISPVSTANWFINFISCSYFDVTKLDASKVTNMRGMFSAAGMSVSDSFTIVGFENWDTSNVINMEMLLDETGMSAVTYNIGDISGWDVSKVTDMSYMLLEAGASSTNNWSLDLSGWNSMRVREFESFSSSTKIVAPDWYTSYAVYSETDQSLRFYRSSAPITVGSTYDGRVVTNVYTGFETESYNYSSMPWSSIQGSVESVTFVNEIIPISTANWFYNFDNTSYIDVSKLNVSNVTDMYSMFNNCSSLTNLNLSDWDTSNVTYMAFMFSGCSGLTTLDLRHFDTSNVTNMAQMFSGCSNLTTLDISGWDTSNVTYMAEMFHDCDSLTSLDLSGWDTSNVTSMTYMFNSCDNLTSLDIGGWDTSNVTVMNHMFEYCTSLINLDLSNWNVSKVTKYEHFNYGASGVIAPNFG